MKIRGITVRVPPLLFAVTVFFAAMCAMMYGSSKDAAYIYIGVPLCIILICMPLAMNYMTEKQLQNQLLGLKTRAKFTRARQISPAMLGTPVVVEGKILKVSGILMGKPVYLISDPTGQMIVRRFAHPDPLVGVGAVVEIVGTIARKITDANAVYVNAVSIRPIKQLRTDSAETSQEKSSASEEKTHIKKLH
ncbi:hypothetical protein [Methanorbis furvi]|uniref:Nucleotide-binding protein n=1 Tax=Methanorbis furvi TaxID=3028299 RepID=A0AAE4MBS9_9EURY|nr:hypothetical protein [Methanocorpusculaceae archaeon Ag1]